MGKSVFEPGLPNLQPDAGSVGGEPSRSARTATAAPPKVPGPHVAAYGGSKAAVEYFGHVLAKELGSRRITVNAVLPGLTGTDGLSPEFRANADKFIAQTPLGRLGRSEDIADVVAFLASDDARWVTGQTIAAAGGLV
ncbi:SDR family oxidoreductase [Streptomyces sp. NPDC001780]